MICPDPPPEPNYAEIDAVCLACIGHPLREEARRVLTLDSCSFCEATGDSIAAGFDEFMELIKTGLFHLYDIGSEVGNPPSGGGDGREWLSYMEVASDHCWEAVGSKDPAARNALFKAIEDSLGDTDPHWTYVDNGFTRLHLRYGWREFRESVTESDFESHWVLNPDEFIGELQKILTWMPGIVVDLPSGAALWRARIYDGGTTPPFELSAKELGSAPTDSAKPNRMSGEGVSMFYGAEQLTTALKEVKYDESTSAAAGQFLTARPLRVVDLTEVSYEPSIFHPLERGDYYAATFLAGFAFDISLPASDARDYLPTQAVTEGIRAIPWDKIDGIRFRSAVDPGGINFVLFCDNDDCGESDDDSATLLLDSTTIIPPKPI